MKILSTRIKNFQISLFKVIISLIIIITPFQMIKADNGESINILTWWGYLDDPQIKTIVKDKCGVNISFDEYYSNDEFLSRFKQDESNYDIIIFSQIMYGVIQKDITLENSSLSNLTKEYVPFILHEYNQNNFPSNVAYFTMSVMGFLWNPKVINLNENDTIPDAFRKAINDNVVLIDDPMEVNNILNLAFGKDNSKVLLTKDNMSKLTNDSNVYITNEYGNIYSTSKFAFSYLWSGDAYYDMKMQHFTYKFLVNYNTSYICPDLIAQLNNDPNTVCVAKVLASKEILNIVQNSDYYFSPYGDSSSIKDVNFKKFYDDIFPRMEKMSWIKPVSEEEFNEMTRTWKIIKINENSKTN